MEGGRERRRGILSDLGPQASTDFMLLTPTSFSSFICILFLYAVCVSTEGKVCRYGPRRCKQVDSERTLPFPRRYPLAKFQPDTYTHHAHTHTNNNNDDRPPYHEALRGLGPFCPVPLLGLSVACRPPLPPVDAPATPASMCRIGCVCQNKNWGIHDLNPCNITCPSVFTCTGQRA